MESVYGYPGAWTTSAWDDFLNLGKEAGVMLETCPGFRALRPPRDEKRTTHQALA